MLAEVGPYARYFVGAQNNVPFQGLPYEDILGGLAADPGQSVEKFASSVVAEYIEYAWFVSPYSATMAAFDLAKVGSTLWLLDALSLQGIKYNSIFHEVVNQALASSEHYDTEWYVDLVDFLRMLRESDLPLEIRALALETTVSFREAIISFKKYDHPDPYDGVGVEHANGAVIYAPSTSLFDAGYSSLSLSTMNNWEDFGRLARIVMPTEEMAPGPLVSYADSDGDGLPDKAHLAWKEDHPLVEAWVYSRLPNGVSLRERLCSAYSNISIHAYFGDLVIAASAVDADGNAISYLMVNMTLYGKLRLEVTLMSGGVSVSDRYDMQVISSSHQGYAVHDEDSLVAILTVPSQASVGEMIVLRIVSGDETLMTFRHVMGEQNSTIRMDLHGLDQENKPDDMLLLMFSLLPAVLTALFAVILYWDYRKTKRED